MKTTRYFFNFCLLLLAGLANSQSIKNPTQINLTAMDEQYYQEPWLTFQQVMALENQFDTMSESQKLWWLFRKAQGENLLYYFDDFSSTVVKAQQFVSATTPIEVKIRLNYFSGIIWQRDSEYKKSSTSLKLAMKQAKAHGLSNIYIFAKRELAYTESLTELFETSLKDIQEAYVKAFQLNDHFLLASINETYGAIYGYMQQYEKSIEYYQKALDSFENLGYKAQIADAIYGLASTYRYWGKFRQASNKFRLYQEKISYTPNTDISFFGAYGLGMTLAEQGSCQEAIMVIDQALSLNGLTDYNAELYKRKASCLIEQGKLDAAQASLNQAEAIFKSLPELIGTAWQLEVLKIAGAIAHARGDHEQGYVLLNEYYQKYADLLIKNSSSRVINVKAYMEIERQEIEKALLLQRIEVGKLEQKQNQLQQSYFIILLATLLIVVIVVVIFQYKTNKKITALSITDPLSGLFNRRYIFQYLDKFIHQTPLEKTQLSILLMDIDDFKHINDTYGHPIGDQVIEMLAAIGQATLRTEDVMGRVGGEEFLCVLPRISMEESQLIATRMIENVSKQGVKNDEGDEIFITISIGMAELSNEISDGKLLYSHADKALYHAKELGKNCVASYPVR